MRHIIFISLLFVILLPGCKPPEEEPYVFDFKDYPGIAVIGNGEVCVIYSDDGRVFEGDNGIRGGIMNYYFEDSAISYIHGSEIRFIDDAGRIAANHDTFGLDPFYSPYKIIESQRFDSRIQVFSTGEGIIAQQVSVNAFNDLNTFVQWSVHTPIEPGDVKITATDVLEDGIYHRYDNGVILAFAAVGEYSQYAFSAADGITTITTPLRLEAGADTTLTFFITAGRSDTEVITKMFSAESIDMFDSASDYWKNWLANRNVPAFPHTIYEQTFKQNLYAVYASELNGSMPAQIIGGPGDIFNISNSARENIRAGNRDTAEEMIHSIIENSNSYGLIPEIENGTIVMPFSPQSSSEFLEILIKFFSDLDV